MEERERTLKSASFFLAPPGRGKDSIVRPADGKGGEGKDAVWLGRRSEQRKRADITPDTAHQAKKKKGEGAPGDFELEQTGHSGINYRSKTATTPLFRCRVKETETPLKQPPLLPKRKRKKKFLSLLF